MYYVVGCLLCLSIFGGSAVYIHVSVAFSCSQVAAKEEVNKMTPLNLAIVFGPNLIWSTNETASLVSLGEINTFTFLLIQHFDTIFTK